MGSLPDIFGGFCKKGIDSNGRMILAVGVKKSDGILKSKVKGLGFQFPNGRLFEKKRWASWIFVGLTPQRIYKTHQKLTLFFWRI